MAKVEHLPPLSSNDQSICERKISALECEHSPKCMKKNKSPGYDGLTVEFYKTFWQELSEIMINSFNESFMSGKLSETQNISILSLIHKKNECTNL